MVQIFYSQITIVCLGIFVKWHIPVRFILSHSHIPTPSHGVQYSILMTLYNMCYGVPHLSFLEPF